MKNKYVERKEQRITFERESHFTTTSGIQHAIVLDYSQRGMKIKSNYDVPNLGEVIIVALPQEDEDIKRRASVMWKDGKVFGIEFFREDLDVWV